jgi:hypothetical protein
MLIKQGLLTNDSLSQLLHLNIKNYINCLNILSENNLSEELLIKLNGILTFNEENEIRKNQNWVGSSKNKDVIVFTPPPPVELKISLERFNSILK